MIDITIQWYLDVIKSELERLKEGKFTGNTSFQLNWKEGNIANMNGGLNRSWRKPANIYK